MGRFRSDLSPSLIPENGSFLHRFDNTFLYKIIKIPNKLIQSPCLMENKTVSATPPHPCLTFPSSFVTFLSRMPTV